MRVFEYRDLLVAVWWDPTPGFFTARAWEEFGRSTPSVQIQLPFYDRQFVSYVDRLDRLNGKELQYVGSKLFDSLFQGDILRLYQHLREQVHPAGTKLRVRLRLDPPIVARLPWECLYDTRQDSFLLNSNVTTVVRYEEHSDEVAPVAIRLPLRVLLAAESPGRVTEVPRVSAEAAAVREAIRSLEAEGLVTLHEVGSALGAHDLTRERLSQLVERDVDVLHIIAECRREMGESAVVLSQENGGGEDLASGEELAGLLRRSSPRLVVLSGGEGAGAASPELAQNVLEVIPAFLAHLGITPDDLVFRFSGAFYRSVAALKPLDAALSDARREVSTHFPLESGWLAPALFLSRKDARVFFNEARERVQKVYQLSEGRYRLKLRETLNRIWPKPERYAQQLLRWIPKQEPLTSLLHSADLLGQPRAASDLVGRFQRLLLMGEAGLGKTMTLYRLFYEAAQPILSYSAKSPLPIYLSLPDLRARRNLVDFVSDGLDRELFLKDLEEGRFLFLMDGLDSLSAAGARRLAAALNEFMRRYPMNRFVVTTRQPAPAPLQIPNCVELAPFPEWEAVDFLVGGGTMRAEPAKVLYEELHRTMGLDAGNPHVLTMARRLWREGARVPSSLSGLYMAFFQVAGASLVTELREGLLPRLALFMSREDRVSITRQNLEDARGSEDLSAGLELAKMTRATADALLTELGKTRLLRGPTAFTFPSLGFQEFLTAVALRFFPIDEVADLVPPAKWEMHSSETGWPHNQRRGPFHGALPLLCGLLEDCSDLVERLIERDLPLAAECFRESPNPSSVNDRLSRAIEQIMMSGDVLSQRVGCLALQAKGDDWAVGVLETVAGDSSSPARAQALEALGKLRSHRSLALLKSASLEKDPIVARAALDALGRIKAS